MKERGILFSAPMVRALLEGRKTQTRRIWKMPKGCEWYVSGSMRGQETGDFCDIVGKGWWSVDEVACAYGHPGDRLWVKEAWRASSAHDDLPPRDIPVGDSIEYIADGERVLAGRYRHARFMPRWASRILLEITAIRVERLQDISEEDAVTEGVIRNGVCNYTGMYRNYLDANTEFVDPRDSYRSLWDFINGAGSWDANPWVWVIEFKRIEP